MNEKSLLTNNKLQTAFKMFDKDGGGSMLMWRPVLKNDNYSGNSLDKTLNKEPNNQLFFQ